MLGEKREIEIIRNRVLGDSLINDIASWRSPTSTEASGSSKGIFLDIDSLQIAKCPKKIVKNCDIFLKQWIISQFHSTGPQYIYIGLYSEKYRKFGEMRFCQKYQIDHISWLVYQIYPWIKNPRQIWAHLDKSFIFYGILKMLFVSIFLC